MLDKVYVVVVEEYTTDWEILAAAWVAGTYVNEEDAEAEADRLEAIQDEHYMAYVYTQTLKVKAKSDVVS